MNEVAIRIFTNEKYHTKFGKGLFKRAIMTGSAELKSPYTKYLIDLYSYEQWDKLAKTPEQVAIAERIAKTDIPQQELIMLSWILFYDPITKYKEPVDGFCVISVETQELFLTINDPTRGIDAGWTLPLRHCTNAGPSKPLFIATNMVLTHSNGYVLAA